MNHLDDYDRPRMRTSLVNGDAGGGDREVSRGRKMGTAGQQEVRITDNPQASFKVGGKFKHHRFISVSVLVVVTVQRTIGDVSARGGAGRGVERGLRGEEEVQDEDGRR